MAEISYYRDSIRNYMVLACGEEEAGRGYQYRMLAANRIPGLLPCSLRYIDDRRLLYYDISSRQKLSVLCEARSLEPVHFRRLLERAAEAAGRLSEYLLDASCLLLDPGYIYADLTGMEFYFVYDPEAEAGTLSLLTAFLTERLGQEDPDLTAAVWELDALAQDPDFVLGPEALAQLLPGERPGTEEPGPVSGEGLFPEERAEEEEPEQEEREQEKSLPVFLPLLALAASLVLFVLTFTGLTEGRTRRLCLAGGTALLAAGLGTGLSVLLKRKGKAWKGAAGKEGAGKEAPERGEKRSFFSFLRGREKAEEKAAADFWGEDEAVSSGKAGPDLVPVPQRVPVEERGPLPVLGSGRQTKVLGGEEPGRLRLYGEDGARGLHIDLEKLPFTVGSSPEFADVLLDDPSVSRLHARIWKSEDGVLQIRDLGSTNGTRINGILLGPEESAGLMKGDIVCFGSLEFHCR